MFSLKDGIASGRLSDCAIERGIIPDQRRKVIFLALVSGYDALQTFAWASFPKSKQKTILKICEGYKFLAFIETQDRGNSIILSASTSRENLNFDSDRSKIFIS